MAERTKTGRVFLLIASAIILIAYGATLHNGAFNNISDKASALITHERSWSAVLPLEIRPKELEKSVAQYGGTCTADVPARSTTPSQSVPQKVTTCVVDRLGRFPLIFVRMRWACEFARTGTTNLRLVSCIRMSGSL